MPNARLLVTVLEPAGEIDTDWPDLAANALANAFGDEEPEYRPQDASHQLQMDDEEVERLLDRSGMTVRGAGNGFGREWVPVEASD